MQCRITANEQETEALGFALGQTLQGGEVIALDGDLGAGKTVFTKGIARALEINGPILSPTFNIVREYSGRVQLYHFDFYRLNEAEELREIGFSEYLRPDAVTVIEWAQLFPEVLPDHLLQVSIQYGQQAQQREITIEGEA